MEIIAEDCKDHPVCPHGPCLKFERRSANGSKTGRQYYACSACRDRSNCHFFHWVDDEFSKQKKMHWKNIIESSKSPFTHDEYVKRLNVFRKLPFDQRMYCKNCSLLILPEEKSKHQKHELLFKITDQQLSKPSELFQSLENNKAEAQYFFSEKTTKFIAMLLKSLGFTKLMLIGVPKLHEFINSKENLNLSSILMDIDHRYVQFYDPDQFCHYNMFNNHFFNGQVSEDFIKQFLTEQKGEKVAVLLDPPFGGLIDAISFTLHSIDKLWKTVNSKKDTDTVPILWFFPYFFQSRIVKNFPALQMMDYKVEYANHKKFGKKINSQGSPVRIFTNISPALFALPENEGYRFCKKCQKFVCKENLHCVKCNSCTTKHGKTYKHCDSCQKCVKSSYVHCEQHNKCSPNHAAASDNLKIKCGCNPNPEDDANDYERCFKCFGYGHRKRNCPVGQKSNKKKHKK